MNSNIIRIIVVLFVILALAQLAILTSESWEPIKAIINDAILDRGILDRYGTIDPHEKEAADSMKALTYATNRLAWFDTYAIFPKWKWDDNINIVDEMTARWTIENGDIVKAGASAPPEFFTYESFGRAYGNTKVIPTIMDTQTVMYTSSNKAEITKEIAKDMVDCFMMYKDNFKQNTRCFAMDFSGIPSTMMITKNDITDGLNALKDDKDMCDTKCQDQLHDITGGEWWELWNWNRWMFDVRGNKITALNNRFNNNAIKICADTRGYNRVYVTDSVSRCKTPGDAIRFTMLIKDFSLPQEFRVHPSIPLLSKGDPNYIMYYQKFPEGEDAAWVHNSYGEIGTFIGVSLTVEGARIALSRIPIAKKFVDKVFASPQVRISFAAAVARITTILKSRELRQALFTRGEIDQSIGEAFNELITYILSSNVRVPDIYKESTRDYLSTKYGGTYVFTQYYSFFVEENFKNKATADLARQSRVEYEAKFNELVERYYKENRRILENDRFSQNFRRDLLSQFNEVNFPNKGNFAQILTDEIELGLTSMLVDLRFMYRVSNSANDKLIELYMLSGYGQDMKNDDINAIVKRNTATFNAADSDYRRRINIVLKMMLEEQEINPLLKAEFNNQNLNTVAENLVSGTNVRARNVEGISFSGVSQARIALSNELAVNAFRVDSETEKFFFLGSNAIGLRTPYKGTVSYDDKWTRDWAWPSNRDRYMDYLLYFGGPWEALDDKVKAPSFEKKHSTDRYLGLLKEADRYYMTMSRDKVWYWHQSNVGLHLVSPCKADVMVRVTQCECHGRPHQGSYTYYPILDLFQSPDTYETGKYYPELGFAVPHFDGTNKMLFQIDPVTKGIVKECKPKGVADYLPWHTTYTPLCMEFTPLIDSQKPNYCYRGVKPLWLGVTDVALNWVLPAACFKGGHLGIALCGVAGRVIYAPMEQACYAWPFRGSHTLGWECTIDLLKTIMAD
jgi:hypothetical protein